MSTWATFIIFFLLVQPLIWLGVGALMTWFGDDE